MHPYNTIFDTYSTIFWLNMFGKRSKYEYDYKEQLMRDDTFFSYSFLFFGF